MKDVHPMAKKAKSWRLKNCLRQLDVAKLLGVSLNAWRLFESGETQAMHPTNMALLEQLLSTENPSQLRESPAAYSARRSFCDSLAAELRVLAEMIQSPTFSGDAKARKFEAVIGTYAENLADYLTAIKETGDTGHGL